MGECNYYLKARFKNRKALDAAVPKFEAFLKEADEAGDFWQKHRGDGNDKAFWDMFIPRFPLVTKYLGKLVGGDSHNGLAGELSFGNEEGYLAKDKKSPVLCYSEYTWHLASWNRLCDFLKSEFGAIKTNWISEEDIDPMDGLHV